MVSYYNPTNMYRHQQAVTAPNASMHSWYTSGYHHQPQMAPASYCMQDDMVPQMWHPHAHSVFNQEFPDFHAQQQAMHQHQMAANDPANHQMPSPTITVSGSEMSSPGAGSGNISPHQNHPQAQVARPPPARSPYEWIKKTSYQTQPNPGKTRTKDKYRVVYTDLQRIELEKEFTFNNKYITIRRKSELATNLGLSERQIKIWFQNRRAKERKQNKKRIEEKNQIEMGNIYQHNLMQQHQQAHHAQNQLIVGIPPTPMMMQNLLGGGGGGGSTLKSESSDIDEGIENIV